MTKPTRPHWSYSSVSQYLRCPLQYYFERVLRLPRRTSSDAQVLGSAVHSALAVYHRMIRSGDAVRPELIQAAYLDAWDGECHRGRIVACGESSLADTRSQGLALVEVYLREPPPENIMAVEVPLLSPIANSRGDYLENPIMIVADLITRQEDGTLAVGELKTSGRAYSESEVATSLQPTFYASSLYEMTGEEPAVGYTILVKTKVPKVQRIEAVRSTNDYRRLGDLIEAVELGIQAGVFYPIESPLNCGGCSFYRACREWTGNRDPGSIAEPEILEVGLC